MMYVTLCLSGLAGYMLSLFFLNLYFAYKPPPIEPKEKERIEWQLRAVIILITLILILNLAS